MDASLPKTRSPFWDLPLQFGGYDADRLQTDGVYTHPSYRRYVPCIATLHLDSLTVRRDVVCGLNKAPSNLYKRVKRRQIEPDNELHDPFIAALLISLAQLRRRDLSMYREERRKAARIAQTGSTMSASAQSPTSTPKYDHANPDPEEPPSFDVCCLVVNLLSSQLTFPTPGSCSNTDTFSGITSSKRSLHLQGKCLYGFLEQIGISIETLWRSTFGHHILSSPNGIPRGRSRRFGKVRVPSRVSSMVSLPVHRERSLWQYRSRAGSTGSGE